MITSTHCLDSSSEFFSAKQSMWLDYGPQLSPILYLSPVARQDCLRQTSLSKKWRQQGHAGCAESNHLCEWSLETSSCYSWRWPEEVRVKIKSRCLAQRTIPKEAAQIHVCLRCLFHHLHLALLLSAAWYTSMTRPQALRHSSPGDTRWEHAEHLTVMVVTASFLNSECITMHL